MAESAKKQFKMPKFSSLEEQAEYLDTLDLSDFEGQFEEVTLEFDRPLIHVAEIEMDARTLSALIKMAQVRGTNFSDLARTWLQERLAIEQASTPQAPVKAKRAG